MTESKKTELMFDTINNMQITEDASSCRYETHFNGLRLSLLRAIRSFDIPSEVDVENMMVSGREIDPVSLLMYLETRSEDSERQTPIG